MLCCITATAVDSFNFGSGEGGAGSPHAFRLGMKAACLEAQERKQNNRTPEENAGKTQTAALCPPGSKSLCTGLLLCKEKR